VARVAAAWAGTQERNKIAEWLLPTDTDAEYFFAAKLLDVGEAVAGMILTFSLGG